MTSSSENLVLILEPDNPSNTILVDESTGKPLFTVRTDHEGGAVTKLLNEDGVQLAQWVWREYRSDLLTFTSAFGTGAKPLSASAWLNSSIIPFNDSVTFKDMQNRTWKWKGNSNGSSLQLFAPTDKSHPAAFFKKYYKYKDPKTGEQIEDPATLTITPTGTEILDMVLVSFLMLEKERRIREKSTVSLADTVGVPTGMVNAA